MTVPIFFAAASASAAVAYGPAFTANCDADVELTENDLPRATVFCSSTSCGSFAARASTRSQLALTSPTVLAKTPGSAPSAYAPASLARAVRESASDTTESRTGPAALAVAERDEEVRSASFGSSPRATAAQRSLVTI